MIVATDELAFGVLLSPSDRPRFWILRLLVNGDLIGDCEPCMVGSAVPIIARRPPFAAIDPRGNRTTVLNLLRSDAHHDATLYPLAESFDDWEVRLYSTDQEVVVVASSDVSQGETADLRLVAVAIDEYMAVVSTIASYWRSISDSDGSSSHAAGV